MGKDEEKEVKIRASVVMKLASSEQERLFPDKASKSVNNYL